MDLEFAITTAQPAPVRSIADRHEALRPTVNPVYVRPQHGDVVAEWACPVCGTSCNRTYHAGRSRVYCTNACRQRAYRWRRRQVVPSGACGSGTPVRACSRDGLHALRSHGDLVAGRRDSSGRQVTACGTFARSARDRPSLTWHTEFIAGGPSSCRTCAALLQVDPTPVATMLERALRYAAEHRVAH